MSEIRPYQAANTLSYVVIAGLVSMQVPHSLPEKSAKTPTHLPISIDPYTQAGSNATFDTYRGVVSGQYDIGTGKFEQAVGNFYAQLLLSQEPLGAEFEKVLYDNLWNLYEA